MYNAQAASGKLRRDGVMRFFFLIRRAWRVREKKKKTHIKQAVVLAQNSLASDGGLPWHAETLRNKNVCIVGPLANATQDFMGGYTAIPRPGDIISPHHALNKSLNGIAKAIIYIPVSWGWGWAGVGVGVGVALGLGVGVRC